MKEPPVPRPRSPVQDLHQVGKIVHPDEIIDLRQLRRQGLAVALHQAAGDQQALGGIGLLVAGQLQDGVHRLLAGLLNKAAGVHQQQLRGLRGIHHLPAALRQAPQHDLRIHQVLGATQGHGVEAVFGFRFSVFEFSVVSSCVPPNLENWLQATGRRLRPRTRLLIISLR